ncbi:MAG: LPS export ABC transporter periplasmic protein LptC [Prolixibacteraceae bacterium]|jgi:LPS export ABC transporter protein LptC|nr:LPS export ABC transporter periplasmic protein LptC [Prolixibacteraceae bacterium]
MESKYSNDKRENGSLTYGISIIGLFVILIISACQTKVSTDIPAELLNEAKIEDMEAINFETFYTDSGVVKYHLQAPKLLVYEADPKNRYNDFPDGFIMQRYDLNRKIVSQMSGNHGKYFVNEKRWEANGNVVLVNSEGDTLRSEELKYNQAEDLIFSDQFVSIKKGDQYITGTGGFKSDTQMSRWSFIKTKGHLYVEGGE